MTTTTTGGNTPATATTCGCPVNVAGDIRCHNCGQMVNKRCWNCRTPRGEGTCPNPVTVSDLWRQRITTARGLASDYTSVTTALLADSPDDNPDQTSAWLNDLTDERWLHHLKRMQHRPAPQSPADYIALKALRAPIDAQN